MWLEERKGGKIGVRKKRERKDYEKREWWLKKNTCKQN